MSKSPSPFANFFKSVVNSPEFQAISNIDSKFSLPQIEQEIQNYDKKFGNIPSPVSKNSSSNQQNTKQTRTTKDDDKKSTLEVKHFVKKEGKPWGFEAVAGMDKLKMELQDSFIKPLKFKFLVEKIRTQTEEEVEDTKKKNALLERLYTEYEKFQISIPTGMLLYGPPGTGKTFITKKLAEELECGFISKNMGEFGSSYLHQTTKNIKDFFDEAKKIAQNEPILLFLDEIDSLVSARTNNVDSNKAEEVSQFLQEFNTLEEEAPNLIVIAATNRPDHLDSALLRSGRLDKKIYIGPPDEKAREELFRMYIEKSGRPHQKIDYKELAQLTDGYVSADIEMICDEVARDASRELLELIDEAENGKLDEKSLDGHKITMKNLRETITETPSSLKMVDMSIYDKWLEKIG